MPRRQLKKGNSSSTVRTKNKSTIKKRAKGIGSAKIIANILGEVYKPAVTNFWNLAKNRAKKYKKAKEDFYYRR